MKKILFLFIVLLLILPTLIKTQDLPSKNKIPNEWIDASTGHKIVRITRREGNNRSFYFHNNPFLKSSDGKDDLMIFYGSEKNSNQLFSVNLSTLNIERITNAGKKINGEIVAPKHREVIYQSGDSVLAANVDDHKTRLLFVFEKGLNAGITTLNADETLLAGTFADGDAKKNILEKFPEKRDFFKRIYEAHVLHSLFIINLKTKELKIVLRENEWINHVQFSPTDPGVLMYCHEGPWEKVDRIWTINVNTGEKKLMHERTVENEIAGHEFWAPDGKTIWFDLQIPKSVAFHFAGVDLDTGKEIRYPLTKDEWSIHFNISPDQKIFCGDGSDSTQVAKARNGKWIYLFTPRDDKLVSEKLVNMSKHIYKLEPNVHFSPDGKWIIFRSNMFGDVNVFAVEIKKQ